MAGPPLRQPWRLMRRGWRMLLVLPIAAAGLAVVIGWLAQQWLQAAGGRRVLERELSAALGRPVFLEGDYRLRLLPRIAIAGQRLAIGGRGAAAALELQSYRAGIAILPLLQGRLSVAAVNIAGGRVDLASWLVADPRTPPPDSVAGQGPTPVAIPAIAELTVRDLRFDYAGGVLLLERFTLSGFRSGAPAALAVEASALRDGVTLGRLALRGSVRFVATAPALQLGADRLVVSRPGQPPVVLAGSLVWTARPTPTITVRVTEAAGDWQADLVLAAGSGVPPAGALHLEFAQPARQRELVAGLESQLATDGSWRGDLSVDLGGQSITGSGCLRWERPPRLDLRLQADEIDLDRLRVWLPAGETAAARLPQPPLTLAVELRIARAVAAGVLAEGTVIRLGAEPACPAPD